ncbi:MAG: DUF2283 domain-containing protein [Patescibacteria group bacterium]|nr:DUF2283 domain-containing protein [Patescibacteria group bacterium]
MAKIKYNKKSKIISIKISNRRSIDSDVQDNVVVDYDKDSNITNIDIMDNDKIPELLFNFNNLKI